MKKTLALASLILAAHFAQAKTICTLASGDGKKMEFDHTLYSGEVKGDTYVFVKGDQATAANFPFKTLRQWAAVDGATMVTISPQKDGGYGIFVGQVDLSKSDDNIVATEEAALGEVSANHPLLLLMAEKNLSVSCVELKD